MKIFGELILFKNIFRASLLICLTMLQNITQQKVTSGSGWGPWSKWQCTATCGGGAGRKTRQCINPGPNKCQGRKYQYGKCNEQPCPVAPKPLSNKGWTPWMPWECPVTCGGGTGSRYRICEDPDICEGPKEETGPCGEEPCPVDPDDVSEDLQRQIDQQLKTSKHNFVVQQGETVIIPCKDRMATLLDRENPDAKVIWIHNGKIVDLDNKRTKMDKGGDLRVKVHVEDNGLWWCSVALTSKASVTVSFAAVGVQNKDPDVTVEKGEPFQMACKAKLLSRLVIPRMDQRWIHNSSKFRELQNVKPEDMDILKISTSNYSSSGIWNCRYTERGAREWVTSVYRVLVIPPKTLIQKILPIILAILVVLVAVIGIGWLYLKRMKKKSLSDFEYEETDEDIEEESIEDFENEPTPLFADQLSNYNKRRSS